MLGHWLLTLSGWLIPSFFFTTKSKPSLHWYKELFSKSGLGGKAVSVKLATHCCQAKLTHCWLDGPLIKYPQFVDVLHTSNVHPCITFLPSVWLFSWYSWTQYWRNWIQRVHLLLVDLYFSKQDPLSRRATKNLQMYLISLLMCIAHSTLSCRILLLALPTRNNFV